MDFKVILFSLAVLFCTNLNAQHPPHHPINETPWHIPHYQSGKEKPVDPVNPYPDVTIETFYHHPDAPRQEEVEEVENGIPTFHEIGPYRLRMGDRLTMSVYGEPATKRLVVVDFTGSISYLLVSSLPAEGRTIDEVRHAIEEQLKAYYKDPILIITATDVIPDFYTIIGEARKPGKKRLVGHTTLLSALSAGGGFNNRVFRNMTIDTVDLDHSFLSRRGEILPIDFSRLVYEGDASQDVTLENGDYIYLASAYMDKIYVVGEVLGAATIELLDTMSLSEAIATAGGMTLRASSRVAVIRGSLGCPEYFLIDINRILKGCACDFPLCPGDIVYVPPRKFQALREIVQGGIRAFVGTLAAIAGTSAFVSITPNATNVITPVPIINTGGSTTFIGSSAGGVTTGVVIP